MNVTVTTSSFYRHLHINLQVFSRIFFTTLVDKGNVTIYNVIRRQFLRTAHKQGFDMIKGMVIAPVILGRISIGETVQRGDKRLPKKSDEFHVTSNVQVNGAWAEHPLTAAIKQTNANAKLRSIPVRIMFDTPDNNFRSGYACFNDKGRQVCASSGDGLAARLDPQQGKQKIDCPTPEFCAFGKEKRCKPYARLIVVMESEFERDPLAGFAFRTTGYNSVSSLTARLNQFHALTDGKMAGMPCNLVLRAKSTAASMRQAIYYTDLEPRETLFGSVAEANRYHAECIEKGVNLQALDKMVASCYSGAPYVESDEEDEVIASEFYPESQAHPESNGNSAGQNFGNNGYQHSDDGFQHGDAGFQHNDGGYQDGTGNSNQNHSMDMQDGHSHQGQPIQDPSQALTEVLQRINMIQDPAAINAGKIWIKNRKDFKNEFERNYALNAIQQHSLKISQAA
jgi:Recombination directionality factor-like